jgi:hypothetical protein
MVLSEDVKEGRIVKPTNAILLSGGFDDLTVALRRASEDILAADKFLSEIKANDNNERLDWAVNDAKNVVRDATNSVSKAQRILTSISNLLKQMKVLTD